MKKQHQVQLEYFAVSDVGRKRANNEDQYLVADIENHLTIQGSSFSSATLTQQSVAGNGHLFAVADGMGGHAAGQWASQIALDELVRHLNEQLPWPARAGEHLNVEPGTALANAFKQCNARLAADAYQHPERAGMGTTLTVALLMWPWTFLAHVGDSRCYLLRDGNLRQLTTDHTVAAQLVQQGVLTPEAARQSSMNRVLWNVLGGNDKTQLEPEALAFRLEVGDLLLLCSDGLNAHLEDREIAQLISQSKSASHACNKLVQAAKAAGGSDNITVVVVRCRAEPARAQQPAQNLDASVTTSFAASRAVNNDPIPPTDKPAMLAAAVLGADAGMDVLNTRVMENT